MTPAQRWLLDVLAEHRWPLGMFASPDMGMALNRRDPPGGVDSLPDTIAMAWSDGLVEFSIEPRNVDEVREWIRAEGLERADHRRRRRKQLADGEVPHLPILLGLSTKGGALWATHFEPDWGRFIQDREDLEDQPFNVPDGMDGVTLTGLNRALLLRVARGGGTLLAEANVPAWRPAYWLAPEPAHKVYILMPTMTWPDLPCWRLPKARGVTTCPPKDLQSEDGWRWSPIDPVALAGASIFDVRVGPEHLQFHLVLRCGRHHAMLDILGQRQVLLAPREVDVTATLTEVRPFELHIDWKLRHGEVVEQEVLRLPNAAAVSWAHGLGCRC
jgi:hypothetical protein